MASSRRAKKGPGRRPQSAKRQRFMELRARGWSVRAAAREVGVSRSSGTNLARGHKVYRNGVVVGFVAPLDRLAVRQISTRYLSQDERIEIADLPSRAQPADDRSEDRPFAVEDPAGAAAQCRPLHDALVARTRDLLSALIRSITWDQGTEDGTSSSHDREARRAGVLLRLPLTVATRQQREHQPTTGRSRPSTAQRRVTGNVPHHR